MQNDLWYSEDFFILCPILEISMLDNDYQNKSFGVAITMGEIPRDTQSDEGTCPHVTYIL